MSPALTVADVDINGFPRASGDEPQTGQREAILTAFSPRERG